MSHSESLIVTLTASFCSVTLAYFVFYSFSYNQMCQTNSADLFYCFSETNVLFPAKGKKIGWGRLVDFIFIFKFLFYFNSFIDVCF